MQPICFIYSRFRSGTKLSYDQTHTIAHTCVLRPKLEVWTAVWAHKSLDHDQRSLRYESSDQRTFRALLSLIRVVSSALESDQRPFPARLSLIRGCQPAHLSLIRGRLEHSWVWSESFPAHLSLIRGRQLTRVWSEDV